MRYAFTVGSLMYVVVCMRSDTTHAVGVVSLFFLKYRQKALGLGEVDIQISQRHFPLCLCFDSGKLKLDVYTVAASLS